MTGPTIPMFRLTYACTVCSGGARDEKATEYSVVAASNGGATVIAAYLGLAAGIAEILHDAPFEGRLLRCYNQCVSERRPEVRAVIGAHAAPRRGG